MSKFKEKLKIKTVVTHYIDNSDLEAAIKTITGKQFELLESPNDTSHTVTVYPTNSDKSFSIKDFEEIKEKIYAGHAEYYYLNDIFNWLHLEGHIDAGAYVIEVCW